MGVLHLRHIRNAIERNIRPHLDLSDLAGRGEASVERVATSRGLAALALCARCDISFATAAEAVTDGFNDHGVDALYYDQTEQRLYIVQSKWHESGTGSLDQAAAGSLASGTRDLLVPRLDRFNQRVRHKEPELVSALENTNLRVVVVAAHTGMDAISEHARRVIADLLDEHNDVSALVSFLEMNQAELYRTATSTVVGAPIDVEVAVREWGFVESPFSAFYGRVHVSEISQWYREHGPTLFDQNLRKFIPHSTVNESIKATLHTAPDLFWYFNNGITVLCNRLVKKPIGGPDRSQATLECQGIAVVNGAQTVGSIAAAVDVHGDAAIDASVFVRFISLEDCPPGFATAITRATNTQNRIEPRDFASLDPEQARLKRDLLMENGKQYAYQTGDAVADSDAGCSIDEAAVALACRTSVDLAVLAKRNVGRLYEDIEKHPYRTLFNPDLTAKCLWNTVVCSRIVERTIKRMQTALPTSSRLTLVHGNRFLQNVVLEHIPADDLCHDEQGQVPPIKDLEKATRVAATALIHTLTEWAPDAYMGSLFKNYERCRELKEKIGEVVDSGTYGPLLELSPTQPRLFESE